MIIKKETHEPCIYCGEIIAIYEYEKLGGDWTSHICENEIDYEKTDVKPSRCERKCPMCGVMHHWPTEDKLCYNCEGVWTGRNDEISH